MESEEKSENCGMDLESVTKTNFERLDINLNALDKVGNYNVRKVALLAKEIKDQEEKDPDYSLKGTYSESYSGERY